MSTVRLRSLSLALAAPALLLLAGGCGKRACFHWTELEGACPSSDDAYVFFQNPGCLSSIESIDSEGDFDGELCCYDVTTVDTGDEECKVVKNPVPGGGGVGGFSGPR
ncbi:MULTISPECIES: hypothetical protein [Sorangium]|uniref:Secreted protein n=1 Tax=Sorangium cellulosum TaxID=56 RepID=A0A4P2QT54_SORCE|nr:MULTISPECIES: hypothetical protein [Sorangium]AUX33450.1 hypothetical protein SOCE836_056100 [Sorangium cellulosum]WCQ92766.1 hypothetical protein NQZ70_05512 [Sorangium sp. Soce836]